MRHSRQFVVLGLAVLLAGCATNSLQPLATEIQGQLTAQRKFKSYNKAFEYIALNESLLGMYDTADRKIRFKIAADSSVEICQPVADFPMLYVITVNFYSFQPQGIFNGIRGAQGNGRFYLLMPSGRTGATGEDLFPEFLLVGIAIGNTYRWSSVNGVPRFISNWHLSAGESPENVYEWDGKVFKLMGMD